VREAAVQKLEKIVKGKNIGMARSAMEALEKIANDDNTTRRVAQMATQILETVRQAEKKAEEERRAREEAERLAALKAEEERLAREKAEAERKAKEEAEKLLRAQAAREEAEREAARLKAEREAAEKAAREAAHRAALEKAEREAAEQEAVQRAEREAMELAARRKAEREAAEQAEREAIELAARRKAEREAKARDTIEVPQATKRSFLTVGIIVTVTVFLIVCGYGMTRLIPLFFVVATPTSPAATEAPVIEPPLTEVPATEPSATKQPTVDITEPPFSVLSSDWPMENHDAARTGFNSAEHNLLPPLRELWNKSITDYYIDDIAVSEGKVALSGMSGSSENSTNQVYMLDATTGAILWNFTLSGGGGGAMNFTPAFGAKSIFFGGQGDTNLYSLNVDSGQVNWQRSGFNGLYASQIATDENRIYVPDEVKGVVAFDPNTGEPIWGNGVGAWGLPTAFRKGIVFGIKSDRGNLVALSETNGTELWQFSGLQAFFTWVVVDADRIYLNVSDSEIAALNISDGTLLWKTKLDINALSSHGPALMNGQLYIPFWTDQVDHGGVIALDTSTGEIHWNFSSGREGVVAVAAANDIVYATGWLSQTVYALSPLDGETLWSYSLGCNGGDLAIAESTLFVTSCDEIYAFINQN
jgi:outer membrane protein assembly factor BamB